MPAKPKVMALSLIDSEPYALWLADVARELRVSKCTLARLAIAAFVASRNDLPQPPRVD